MAIKRNSTARADSLEGFEAATTWHSASRFLGGRMDGSSWSGREITGKKRHRGCVCEQGQVIRVEDQRGGSRSRLSSEEIAAVKTFVQGVRGLFELEITMSVRRNGRASPESVHRVRGREFRMMRVFQYDEREGGGMLSTSRTRWRHVSGVCGGYGEHRA